MKFLFWLSALTWEFPQTLLALFIKIFYRNKVKQKEKYKLSKVFWLKANSSFGVSLGRFIFLDQRYKDRYTKKHEYGHSIQSLIFGPLYLIIIGLPSMIRCKFMDLTSLEYYSGYPERWADKLGKVKRSYHA